MTAGIAAATIIRQGIATHTSSVARFWRKDGGREAARRELQIASSIVANTPAATSMHIVRIASLMPHTLQEPITKASALHPHQLIHGHHVVVEMRHDHHRAENYQARNEHTESQREEVVRLVGCARDVEERTPRARPSARSRAPRAAPARPARTRMRSWPPRTMPWSERPRIPVRSGNCVHVLLVRVDTWRVTLRLNLHVHYSLPDRRW